MLAPYMVAGCPFVPPAGNGPCVMAQWVVGAMRAVLPKDASLIMVGGITTDLIGPYLTAGATAFGLGSSLFKPGASAATAMCVIVAADKIAAEVFRNSRRSEVALIYGSPSSSNSRGACQTFISILVNRRNSLGSGK